MFQNQQDCANCQALPRDCSGVCAECFNLYLNGQDVQIKNTLDKDVWSCGCQTRAEGLSYCAGHRNGMGPLGDYNAELDLDLGAGECWGKSNPTV